jgi:dTDP-4-dehydrorhamnose reductase
MYGQAGPGSNNFLQQWLAAWRKGETVQAFEDEVRSFLSGNSAAEGLYFLLEKGAEGIFNIGGADTLSRYEFAEMAAQVFDLPQAKTQKAKQGEVAAAATRPANLNLDLTKIKGLGFVPVRVLDGLRQLRAEEKSRV